jgi:hypothetical protein
MTTAKAISIIYDSALKVTGNQFFAKEAVATTLTNIISELHEKGLPVTEERIRSHLVREAQSCLNEGAA